MALWLINGELTNRFRMYLLTAFQLRSSKLFAHQICCQYSFVSVRLDLPSFPFVPISAAVLCLFSWLVGLAILMTRYTGFWKYVLLLGSCCLNTIVLVSGSLALFSFLNMYNLLSTYHSYRALFIWTWVSHNWLHKGDTFKYSML